MKKKFYRKFKRTSRKEKILPQAFCTFHPEVKGKWRNCLITVIEILRSGQSSGVTNSAGLQINLIISGCGLSWFALNGVAGSTADTSIYLCSHFLEDSSTITFGEWMSRRLNRPRKQHGILLSSKESPLYDGSIMSEHALNNILLSRSTREHPP